MRVQPDIFTNEIKFLFGILLNGHDEVRLVGGCVRNYILGRKINDYDLATKYKPEELINIFEKNGIKYYKSGIDFGTITAIINGKSFEITTLRKDIKPDGRHTLVEFTDNYEIDAARRDFTINALYCDINYNIYDYFNGISDIKKGILRFIGNPEKRIIEDNLRILRFFRFYSYYSYSLDYKSLKACEKFANKICNLSKERIAKELKSLFESKYPLNALLKMQSINIIQIIFGKKLSFKYLEIFYSINAIIHNYKFNYLVPIVILIIENNIDYKFLITKKEKNFVSILLKNRINEIDEFKIKKLLFNYKDKDLVKDIIMVNICINYKKEYLELLKNIDNIDIPKFNINAKVLQINGFNNSKKYSLILEKMKDIFIESNFSMNEDDIMKKYKDLY